MVILYALLLVGALIAVGLYVARRLDTTLAVLVPGLSIRTRRRLRVVYYLAMYTFPAVVATLVAYALLGPRKWIEPPESVWIDYFLVYPFWIVSIFSAQCAGFFLLIDLGGFVAARVPRIGTARARRWHAFAIAAVMAFFAIYLPARVVHDSHTIDVRQTTLAVADLPRDMEGFRIALIADPQADRYTDRERLERYADMVNAEHPDVVLIAGDLITRGPNHIELAAEAAGRLRAPRGVYSCIGDHDNWAFGRDGERSVRAITEALARHGVSMIDDDVVMIDGRPGAPADGNARAIPRTAPDQQSAGEDHSIAILVVTDNYMKRSDTRRLDAMLEAARRARVRVLLSHQPSLPLVTWAMQNPIDLFLAGHTHGGQITLRFPFWRFTPAQFESPYVRGSFVLGTMRLIVSSGLGVSVAPFRYNSTPTIDVITLTATSPTASHDQP